MCSATKWFRDDIEALALGMGILFFSSTVQIDRSQGFLAKEPSLFPYPCQDTSSWARPPGFESTRIEHRAATLYPAINF